MGIGVKMKNIVVCVDLREESLKILRKLGEKISLIDARVHLVHAFEVQVGIAEYTAFEYPLPHQYPEIKNSVMMILDNLQRDLHLLNEQVEKHCMFNSSKEEVLKKYLEDKNADLVVISTRGKHGIEGFFSSSLADFLCKYSPCDVLVMRPEK